MVLGIKARASAKLGKHSVISYIPTPIKCFFKELEERILKVPNTNKGQMIKELEMLITPISSLHTSSMSHCAS